MVTEEIGISLDCPVYFKRYVVTILISRLCVIFPEVNLYAARNNYKYIRFVVPIIVDIVSFTFYNSNAIIKISRDLRLNVIA